MRSKEIEKEMKKMNEDKINGKLEIHYNNGIAVKLRVEVHKNLKK